MIRYESTLYPSIEEQPSVQLSPASTTVGQLFGCSGVQGRGTLTSNDSPCRTMLCLLALCFVPLVLAQVPLSCQEAEGELAARYPCKVIVSEDPAYSAYYGYNATTDSIEVFVSAESEGYVGWAVSPDGFMPGSYGVVAEEVSPSSLTLTRYHLDARRPPVAMENQDFTLSEVTRGMDSWNFTFNYPVTPTEGLMINDSAIGGGTNFFLWSVGDDDSPTLTKRHSERGSYELSLDFTELDSLAP
ncbi:unnamed protein product [Chrysoparadoxa australica]